MGSEDHKKNLLLEHMQHVGFGSAPGDGGRYWCAVYAQQK
jgi:hypothetical protein